MITPEQYINQLRESNKIHLLLSVPESLINQIDTELTRATPCRTYKGLFIDIIVNLSEYHDCNPPTLMQNIEVLYMKAGWRWVETEALDRYRWNVVSIKFYSNENN